MLTLSTVLRDSQVASLSESEQFSITSKHGRLGLRETAASSLEFYGERSRRTSEKCNEGKNIKEVLKYVENGDPGPWIDKIMAVWAWMDAAEFPTFEKDFGKLFIQARADSLLSSDVAKISKLLFVQGVTMVGDRDYVKVRIDLRD